MPVETESTVIDSADFKDRIRFYEKLLKKNLVLFTGPNNTGKSELAWGIYTLLRNHLSMAAFPAERVAVHLLADASPSPKRYLAPIQDILSISSGLLRASEYQEAYADLAEEIERTILGGSISVHGQLSFRSGSSLIEIRDAGLAVKALGSFVFYLRHLARKGDVVVIDEPELGLHPDNQRKVARVLAKAVNRGLRVLASTHSDYLIRELNHLILLSRPGDAMARVREQLGCDPESLLAPEQLGVYFFDGTGNRELPVDEQGFEVATIEAAIDDINADSQAIHAALLED